MHRLVRISTSSQRHLSHRDTLVKLHKRSRETRTFSTSSAKRNESEGDHSDSSPLSTGQALVSRRRRPLSPLERISSLLPQDALSPEVMQLREQDQQDPEEDADVQALVTREVSSGHVATPKEDESEAHHASDAAEEPGASETLPDGAFHGERRLTPATLPGESLLAFGELLVAEYRKKKRWVEFRKMFQLQAGKRLQSSWGVIPHNDIAGQPAGSTLMTSKGVPILIYRVSLEDYVLYMKRGPAIAYPKVQY